MACCPQQYSLNYFSFSAFDFCSLYVQKHSQTFDDTRKFLRNIFGSHLAGTKLSENPVLFLFWNMCKQTGLPVLFLFSLSFLFFQCQPLESIPKVKCGQRRTLRGLVRLSLFGNTFHIDEKWALAADTSVTHLTRPETTAAQENPP